MASQLSDRNWVKPKMAGQLFLSVNKDFSVRALTVFADSESNEDVGTLH